MMFKFKVQYNSLLDYLISKCNINVTSGYFGFNQFINKRSGRDVDSGINIIEFEISNYGYMYILAENYTSNKPKFSYFFSTDIIAGAERYIQPTNSGFELSAIEYLNDIQFEGLPDDIKYWFESVHTSILLGSGVDKPVV